MLIVFYYSQQSVLRRKETSSKRLLAKSIVYLNTLSELEVEKENWLSPPSYFFRFPHEAYFWRTRGNGLKMWHGGCLVVSSHSALAQNWYYFHVQSTGSGWIHRAAYSFSLVVHPAGTTTDSVPQYSPHTSSLLLLYYVQATKTTKMFSYVAAHHHNIFTSSGIPETLPQH